MRRWRRFVVVALGAVTLGLLLRAALSLRPPHIAVAPERQAILGVTVINPGRDRRPDQTITLRAGVIESIRDSAPVAARLPRDRVFDHGYALPGLIDLDVRRLPHRAHLRALFGVWFLAAGVTTVRVSGGDGAELAELRRQIAAEEVPWPRLVACGPLLTGESIACAGARVVRTPDEATAAIEALVAAGAPCVAVHRSLSAAAFAALREAAAAKGLPLVGDRPAAADAAFAGARLISGAPPAPPARSAADWLRGWQASASDGAPLPAPTTGVQRWAWLTLPEGSVPVPYADLLPRFYRDVVWPRQRAQALTTAAGQLGTDALREAVEHMIDAVRRARAAGESIALGSSTPAPYVAPGTSLWLEMIALANAGLPLEELWAAATRQAGEALGIPKLGVLEDGAPADLLIFRDDPTRDIAAFTSLQAVVSRGRLYPARILNGDMLEYARYVQRPLYDWLTVLAARLGMLDEDGDPDCDPL